jgi:hypothetical protein
MIAYAFDRDYRAIGQNVRRRSGWLLVIVIMTMVLGQAGRQI